MPVSVLSKIITLELRTDSDFRKHASEWAIRQADVILQDSDTKSVPFSVGEELEERCCGQRTRPA